MNKIEYRRPGTFEINRFEKLHNVIFDNMERASLSIANEIRDLIILKQKENKPCVLGLATGSSPLTVYKELIQMHKEGLSFKNVMTFNLDEYFLLPPEHIESYHCFMHEHLFNHIDINPKNIHIPSGTLSPYEIDSYCSEYEKKISKLGGIDIQLLGIGRNGHIGFNEPGSHINSLTRLLTLDYLTRFDAASSFNGIENVPKKAITVGIHTILSAKKIILMAWGINKASVIRKAIECEIDSNIPCSYLQKHHNTIIILDNEAASEITRIKTPWLVSSCEWNDQLSLKAVIWLCNKTQKSVLKLTDQDYNKYGMSDLINADKTSYNLNIKIFNKLQNMITGWPGGNKNKEITSEPTKPNVKRCLIFSPHPDDDVISMGGTLDRLISQGHEVHVAYQTSGNIAVANQEVLKYLEVSESLSSSALEKVNQLKEELENQGLSHPSINLLAVKGKIRESEARAALRFLGMGESNIHFMNLSFYETGKVQKRPISNFDIEPTIDLINKIKPHQIYAAGDLADPHGTHRKCLDIVCKALTKIRKQPYAKDCCVWLYRGAWLDWELHEVEMAVPMSPSQVLRKRKSIFYHQTQKDGVLFQGNDMREFWKRAEDRNQNNARKFNDIGLVDYEAIELFKQYNFL